MYEMLFHYFPAFVAQVVDASRVRIWLQHPKYDHINYDLDKTIVVDLDKTPSNVSIQWDDIEVDDYVNRPDGSKGFTTLGPIPGHMHDSGGVYLSASYCSRNAAAMARALASPQYPMPGPQFELGRPLQPDYQLPLDRKGIEESAVVLAEIERGRQLKVTRFHGFHHEVGLAKEDSVPSDCSDDSVQSGQGIIRVAQPGGSTSPRPYIIARLADEDVFVPHGFIRARRGPASTSRGDQQSLERVLIPGDPANPIFIEYGTASSIGLDIPKRPSGSVEGAQVPPGGLLRRLVMAARSHELPETFVTWLSDASIDSQWVHHESRRAKRSMAPDALRGPLLNVFEESTYGEVSVIEARMQGNCVHVRRAGRDPLADVLTALPGSDKFRELCLIAHAGGRDGVLRFNGVQLTAQNIRHLFTRQAVDRMTGLGIEHVRILGCRTAAYSSGRAALLALSGAPGMDRIKVSGTRGDVFAVHYARGLGFTEHRLLVDSSVIVGDPPPVDDVRSAELRHGDPKRPAPPDANSSYEIRDLVQIPFQKDSSTPSSTLSFLWQDPNIADLRRTVMLKPVLASEVPEEVSPIPLAAAQIVFFLGEERRAYAFDIMSEAKSTWIRMQYPGTCRRHNLQDGVDYEQLNQAFKPKAHQ
jgi:hypothetical protein